MRYNRAITPPAAPGLAVNRSGAGIEKGRGDMDQTFGEFLRDRRLRAGFGLRAFAEAAGLQASNLSNIEHGRLAPPQDKEKLDDLAELLNLPKGSAERGKLYDLAADGAGRLPADVAAFAA